MEHESRKLRWLFSALFFFFFFFFCYEIYTADDFTRYLECFYAETQILWLLQTTFTTY